MQIMTVYLVQQSVVSDLHISSAPNLPNVFLVDITNDEIAGVKTLLKGQSSVTVPPELLPVISSRIVEPGWDARGGCEAEELSQADVADDLADLVRGSACGDDGGERELVDGGAEQGRGEESGGGGESADGGAAGVHVGSTITFGAQDTKFTATVVALTRSDGQHAFSRADFILPQAVLSGFPTVWYGGVHADPQRVGELQRALYQAYPTVTVINVAQALETVRTVVIQITYVIQFLAAFSIFAGVIILASSIAGTRYPGIARWWC